MATHPRRTRQLGAPDLTVQARRPGRVDAACLVPYGIPYCCILKMAIGGILPENKKNRDVTRRELIKKSIAAGGAVWVAPVLLSQPVSAQSQGCEDCPPGSFFRLKSTDACGCDSGVGANDCLTTGIASCCLFNNGVTLSCPDEDTDVWTLAPGIEYCAAASKAGTGCNEGNYSINVVNNQDGTTTVTINDPSPQSLSHSEIQVCVRGSLPGSCITA